MNFKKIVKIEILEEFQPVYNLETTSGNYILENGVVSKNSIGQGKTTAAAAGLLYDMCKIMHLRDPFKKYSILPTSYITFALMNATQTLARGVVWDKVMSFINNSPFFEKQRKVNEDPASIFKGIKMASGSSGRDILGKDTVSAIFSELNFATVRKNQSFDMYNTAYTRLQTRFRSNNKGFPGRFWIDTSKKESGSFVDSFLIKERGMNPEFRIYDSPIWDVLPEWKIKYSGERFEVFIGNNVRDPAIIKSDYDRIGLLPEEIIRVPSEYRDQFNANVFQSLQDLAGVLTPSTSKFIGSPSKITEALVLANPVTKDVIRTDFYDKDQSLIDFIDYDLIVKDSRPRFIHIDLGLVKDKTGICSVRMDGVREITKIDRMSGQFFRSADPLYHVDFAMCIESSPGQQVPIYKIKELMVHLRSRGYPLILVSTDGFQSVNLRQDLELDGFETDLISVDRTMDPYIELKNSIFDSRIKVPFHPILSKELKDLEVINGKVDHPMSSSKDLADALAGAIYSCKIHGSKYSANISPEDLMEALTQSTVSTIYDKIKSGNWDGRF